MEARREAHNTNQSSFEPASGVKQKRAVRQHNAHLANAPQPLAVATAALYLLRCPTDGAQFLKLSALPSSTGVLRLTPRQGSVPDRLRFPEPWTESGLTNSARPASSRRMTYSQKVGKKMKSLCVNVHRGWAGGVVSQGKNMTQVLILN